MFPLGTVLLPHMVLPLHIFEPRYRSMFRHLMEGDREFGVVRIDDGVEVGGGETRSHVGTIARIVQAEELEDGRWLAVTVGTRRLRVEQWFPDDPYPQAGVIELAEDGVDAITRSLRDDLHPRVRRLLALRSELGDATVPATFPLADDLATSCWQLLVLTPLEEDRRQVLLETDGWDERLRVFDSELARLEAECALELDALR
jgi:uncharacterized protein